MAGWGHCSIRLFLTSTLIVSLVASLHCEVARGDDLSAGKSFRPKAAAFAPIGKVYSLGEISINGRTVYGEQMIWGSEVLQVSKDASASVLLDSIAQVTLKRRTVVKFATMATNLDDKGKHSLLVASLTSGEIVVKLEPDAVAYIESCGSAFRSSSGASFNIGVREQRAVIDLVSGVVETEPQGKRKLKVYYGNLKLSPNLPRLPEIRNLDAHAGDRKRYDYSVTKKEPAPGVRKTLFVPVNNPISRQAPQNEQPAPGRMLSFTVIPLTAGRFEPPTVPTDPDGVATLTFIALNPGVATITATVVIDPATEEVEDWVGTINIVKALGFFQRRRNQLLIAAAVGVIVCAVACKPPKKPLMQVPPPVIP